MSNRAIMTRLWIEPKVEWLKLKFKDGYHLVYYDDAFLFSRHFTKSYEEYTFDEFVKGLIICKL
jgi:hypothetical protein